MHRLIAAALLLLAACGQKSAPVPEPVVRNTDAQIYSSAVLEMPKIVGSWVQVASVDATTCGPGKVEITATNVIWDLCLPDGQKSGQGAVTPGKPGRFAVDGMADWWVLWVDADYRTMVIGTPDGQFGFVLNRDAVIPTDRRKAARDLLQFNGYDASRVQFY